MTVFSAAEKTRIETCIAEVEQRTAAEIVVVTHKKSDAYLDMRLAAAAALALVAASIMHFVWPDLSVGFVLALQLAAGGLGWWLTSVRGVLRFIVPVARRKQAVERACALAFLEHAAFETRDRTGVVIYLSELEQRVAILGDKGIHERVDARGWDELIAQVVKSMQQGRGCDGVCEVIARLSETLARDAPIRHDDTNELSNHVREGA